MKVLVELIIGLIIVLCWLFLGAILTIAVTFESKVVVTFVWAYIFGFILNICYFILLKVKNK